MPSSVKSESDSFLSDPLLPDSPEMSLKRVSSDVEVGAGARDAQKPKKICRRADPVQAVNMANLVHENIEIVEGFLKYKSSDSQIPANLYLNLTTKENKLLVHMATLESDDRSKFTFDASRGDLLSKMADFIDRVKTSPKVQKRLSAGHRFFTPLRSDMIHAAVDYRQNAKVTPAVLEVNSSNEDSTNISNIDEFTAGFLKLNGFCDWEAAVQVAPYLYFIDKGSEPSVILCFYVTQMYMWRSAARRTVGPQDELEV